MINPSSIGSLIAARIRRIDVLSGLIKESLPESWSEERREDLEVILRRIKELEDERNRIAHWTWWGSLGDKSRAYAESKTTAKRPEPMYRSAEELDELAGRINNTTALLMSIVFDDQFRGSLPG
jgi:hypothetical protein